MIIAFAIPVFFLLIGIEAALAHWRRVDAYRFDDAITDLACGIGSQVVGLFLKGGTLLLYWWTWEHLRLLDLSASSVGVWVATFVAVDFVYYWWHRASHRVNALWAAHIVHHHSQDYNLAVALRQAWFTRLSSAVFNLPLAILGVPVLVFAVNDAANTLYQFWIHTRLVGKLGPVEWIMNTPSHHRVHHGINPEYIDKNYAGVLIVWDRLFGTFAEERAPVAYGTVQVFRSWNAIWANFHYWLDLARVAATTPRLADKLWVWLAPPEWTPDGPKVIPPISPDTQVKWDTSYPPGVAGYVVVQFVPVALATTAMLSLEDLGAMGPAELAIPAGLVLWTLWCWGGLFEGRWWAVPAEATRLVAVMVYAAVVTVAVPALWPAAAGLAVVGAVSMAWLLGRIRRRLSPAAA